MDDPVQLSDWSDFMAEAFFLHLFPSHMVSEECKKLGLLLCCVLCADKPFLNVRTELIWS